MIQFEKFVKINPLAVKCTGTLVTNLYTTYQKESGDRSRPDNRYVIEWLVEGHPTLRSVKETFYASGHWVTIQKGGRWVETDYIEGSKEVNLVKLLQAIYQLTGKVLTEEPAEAFNSYALYGLVCDIYVAEGIFNGNPWKKVYERVPLGRRELTDDNTLGTKMIAFAGTSIPRAGFLDALEPEVVDSIPF